MQTTIVSYSLSRNNQRCGTATIICAGGKFTAGLATSGGFKQSVTAGESPVDALYNLMGTSLGGEFQHELKTQVLPKQYAN
jgi:hypothetical protein